MREHDFRLAEKNHLSLGGFRACRLKGLTTIAGGLLAEIDFRALRVAILAVGVGVLVFALVPVDPSRLNRFAGEHVVLFRMADSRPLRLAFFAFFISLIAGGLFLRRSGPAQSAPPMTPMQLRLVGLCAALLLVFNLFWFGRSIFWSPTGHTLPEGLVAAAYAACAAVLFFNRRLPPTAVMMAAALAVLAACWPDAADLVLRVKLSNLAAVDQHVSALFSGGPMLASGYRLFADIPVGYGILTPVALAGALRAGFSIDFGRFLQLVAFYQVLSLGLFIIAAWTLTKGAEKKLRFAAVLLVVLVAGPMLALGNVAVQFPNNSGFRFVMLPLGVLALTRIQRGSFAGASALVGAVAMLALLHNTETGIAVLAGLGLAWLLRIRSSSAIGSAVGLTAGLAAATAVACLFILAHRAMLGDWPVLEFGGGRGLLQSFGSGFGGLPPTFRIAVFIIFGHAGYVFVRALATLLGRQDAAPDIASAGIAATMIAWAPYYANRPDEGQLWSYYALYALLLAPAIANFARTGRLPLVLGLLMLPILAFSLRVARGDIDNILAAAAMPVQEGCVSGLSLLPEACAELQSRTTELRQVAGPGDVLWITAYPMITFELAKLKPLVAPLDLYASAFDEADLPGVAARIRAARPIALLLDGTAASLTGDAIPKPMRSLHMRIASLAGYAPCPKVVLSDWQAWLPPENCTDTAEPVLQLRMRAGER